MTSSALTLTPINGEPRVKDLHLADRLGFADQYMIRKLIKRNEDKLLRFGIVSTVETIHEGAGRPTAEFYLNQKQAIFLCMKGLPRFGASAGRGGAANIARNKINRLAQFDKLELALIGWIPEPLV